MGSDDAEQGDVVLARDVAKPDTAFVR